MARVTVEDCVTKVQNRFDLVLYSGQRSRQISSGAPLEVERDNDKNTVVALREIAEEKIQPSDLEDQLVRSMQKHVEQDDPHKDDDEAVLADDDAKTDTGMAAEAVQEVADGAVITDDGDGMIVAEGIAAAEEASSAAAAEAEAEE